MERIWSPDRKKWAVKYSRGWSVYDSKLGLLAADVDESHARFMVLKTSKKKEK